MKSGRIAYFVFKITGTSSQFCLLVSAVDVKGPIKVGFYESLKMA